MPTVTGTLTDIGLDDLSPYQPTLHFAPSEGAANGNGHIFAGRPVEVVPEADGGFVVDLATTDDVLPASAHWVLTIKYLSPDGYGAGGYTASERLKWKIRVPAGGGFLSDMLDAPVRANSVWIGTTPPDPAAGYDFWIDVSTSPATLNEWSD